MYSVTKEDIKKAQDNKEYLGEIIKNNSKLIWSIVKRFLGRGYDGEELYQIGCIGFIKAIQRFDIEYDVQISTYAVPYILGEIKRFLRDDGIIKVSRSIKELSNKIKETQREYYSRGEEIGITELSRILKTSKEEIAIAMEANTKVESIDEAAYEEDGESIVSNIKSNKNEEEDIVNEITLTNLIKELSDREKEIILLRYYEDRTQNEVAKIFNISQVQVSRIEKKILLKLRSKV